MLEEDRHGAVFSCSLVALKCGRATKSHIMKKKLLIPSCFDIHSSILFPCFCSTAL